MSDWETRYTQVDADVMLGVDKDITDKFKTSAFVGANSNSIKYERLNLGGNDFIVPGFEDMSNLASQSRSHSFSERKIGSLYGSLELSWDQWAFLTFTGRNDWFSTLSYSGKDTPNDVFYPSVNSSLVLSDALELPEAISFLKLRGGWSKVGGGGDTAYQFSHLRNFWTRPFGPALGQDYWQYGPKCQSGAMDQGRNRNRYRPSNVQ
jgi:hypothetical protein